MTISVGDKIPEVTLIKATAEGPQPVKSSDYFAGKRVALKDNVCVAGMPMMNGASTLEGYVPNVVYTCGAIRGGDDLFLPYGVADSSVCFAFVAIRDILSHMV